MRIKIETESLQREKRERDEFEMDEFGEGLGENEEIYWRCLGEKEAIYCRGATLDRGCPSPNRTSKISTHGPPEPNQ